MSMDEFSTQSLISGKSTSQMSSSEEPMVSDRDFDIESIVDKYEKPLMRYVFQILGSKSEEAEDVVQEAFIRLCEQIKEKGLSEIKNVTIWLFRVAHNLAIDAGRKKSRRKNLMDRIGESDYAAESEDDGLTELMREETRIRVVEELKKMPSELGQVLYLKISQDLKLREIGEVMNLSIGKVAYRLNQALGELGRRLEAKGVI